MQRHLAILFAAIVVAGCTSSILEDPQPEDIAFIDQYLRDNQLDYQIDEAYRVSDQFGEGEHRVGASFMPIRQSELEKSSFDE